MEWKFIASQRGILSRDELDSVSRKVSSIESRFSKDDLIILLSGSYGDVYPPLALFHSLVKVHARHVNVILNEKYRSLAIRFAQEGVSFFFTERDVELRQSICLIRPQFGLERGKIFPALPTLFPFLAEASLSQRITTFMELYRLLFELPKESPLKWHGENIDQIRQEARLFFTKQNLPEKETLIVSLVTHSQKPLAHDLQERVLQELSRRFFVVINTATDKPKALPPFYSLYKNVHVPAYIPTEFAELAGRTLVGYSGLAYILAVQPHNANVLCLEKKFNVNLNIPTAIVETLPISISAGPDFSNSNNFREILFLDHETDDLPSMVLRELDC